MVEQIDFKFGLVPAALDFGEKNSIGLIEFTLMPSPATSSPTTKGTMIDSH